MISVASLIITAGFVISLAALAIAIMAILRIGKECKIISAQFDRHAKEMESIRASITEIDASLMSVIRSIESSQQRIAKNGPEKEEPVRQFTGAIAFRKFMEQDN